MQLLLFPNLLSLIFLPICFCYRFLLFLFSFCHFCFNFIIFSFLIILFYIPNYDFLFLSAVMLFLYIFIICTFTFLFHYLVFVGGIKLESAKRISSTCWDSIRWSGEEGDRIDVGLWCYLNPYCFLSPWKVVLMATLLWRLAILNMCHSLYSQYQYDHYSGILLSLY